MDPHPFRYRHDIALVRQCRWYLEAIVFSAAVLIAIRAVRGILEWSSTVLAAAILEFAVGTAVVLAVSAVAHGLARTADRERRW
jgi:hypothetical protein